MQKPPRTGVQIGLHVPDAFGPFSGSVGDILPRCTALGVSVVELDAAALETMLGAPPEPAALHPPEIGFEHGLLPLEEEVFQDALDLARRTFAAKMSAWRATASLAPLDAFRRPYDEAGVRIQVVRWPDLAALTDAELDYAFRVALTVGAHALSTELSFAGAQRLGARAERHGLRVGFHEDDDAATAADFELALSHSPANAVSLNLGDWVTTGRGSPLPFLAEHAGRITHVRLEDRRTSDGAATWFGQGDAPIREVLQAMRNDRRPFPAIVEIAYDLADEAAQLAEVARAIEYCRACLDDQASGPEPQNSPANF